MAESDKQVDEVYARIASIIEQARGNVARTIDTAMVQAYCTAGVSWWGRSKRLESCFAR